MRCFQNEQPMKHARLVSGTRIGPTVLVALVWLASVGTPIDAQSRGRSTTVHSGASKSTTTTRPVGRYRDYGRVRGGTGARPQAQPYLQTNLSGILPPGFGGHSTRPRTQAPHSHVHGRPISHHAPQVVYVPVGYYQQQRQPEPVIVVQQAPPPVQQPVVIVQSPPAFIPPPPPAPPRPTSNEPGVVRLSVEPPGAEIVLDDRRLGTAGEVSGSQDHIARPGVHVLEVTHPDHRAELLVFAVDPESTVQLVIDLRETRASRRTRIE